jgi:hypothetical protein
MLCVSQLDCPNIAMDTLTICFCRPIDGVWGTALRHDPSSEYVQGGSRGSWLQAKRYRELHDVNTGGAFQVHTFY